MPRSVSEPFSVALVVPTAVAAALATTGRAGSTYPAAIAYFCWRYHPIWLRSTSVRLRS